MIPLLNYWPARRDSNPRSSESESAALSSCATGRFFPIIPLLAFSFKKIIIVKKPLFAKPYFL